MNKVIMMGRLTRDPEIRYSQGNTPTAIARISIAVDRRYKQEGQPDADFFNCTAFGRQAEFIEHYLHKGTKILLCGTLQNNNYTNKDGQQVYSIQILVNEIEFAESKNASANNGNGGAAAENSNQKPVSAADGFMNIPDGIEDELPFN